MELQAKDTGSTILPPSSELDQRGKTLRRLEDEALVCGRGQFVDDVEPSEQCLQVSFLRSPVAHAHVTRIDTSLALEMPGVRWIATGADAAALRPLAINAVAGPVRSFPTPYIATDICFAVGMPVAMVVADSLDAARDAAEAIEVEYDPLEAVIDVQRALYAPPVFQDWPDNVAFERQWKSGDCGSAFARAHKVVEAELSLARVSAVPMEPRGAIAAWQDGRLHLNLAVQSPHRARDEIAAILGLPKEAVRLVTGNVGGAFGMKASASPEDVLVAWAALRLGRKVKWIATRNEDFVYAPQGRGGLLRGRLALDKDGRALALDADIIMPVGCRATFSVAVPAWNAARILPGPYDVPNLSIRTRAVVSHTATVGIYRGAGRPEAAMLMETLMDKAASTLGLAPEDIRARNTIPALLLPRPTLTGGHLDSGDYGLLLQKALEAADMPRLREWQKQRRQAGFLSGIGIALYIEPCGQGFETATITHQADGRFLVATGSSSQGQGHATAFAQIAASFLGVPVSDIDVVEGDTERCPAGIGALASRSMAIGGTAVAQAATTLRRRLEGSNSAGQSVSARFEAPREAWSTGCCIVAVEIDPATGILSLQRVVWADDSGSLVNPLLAKGQLLGGFAQGLGSALYEHVHYDDNGQLLTGSLTDYAIPRADQMPPITVIDAGIPSTANPLGIKGVGEAGCIAAPPAILGAVRDALQPMGVELASMPLTSELIWRAIEERKSGGSVE